jgi:hypothetical protein
MFADSGHIKSEEQNLAEDVGMESAATAGANKHTNEDDTNIPFPVWSKLILIESSSQKHNFVRYVFDISTHSSCLVFTESISIHG